MLSIRSSRSTPAAGEGVEAVAALAAATARSIKPASPTPWSILKLMETIEDILPQGVINVVTGPGAEIGKALAANPRIAKVSFTGETVTGRLVSSTRRRT